MREREIPAPLPPRSSTAARFWRLLPWVSLAVAGLVFIALLGGFHPSDRRRDLIVHVGLGLVVLLQIPSLVRVARRPRGTSVGRELLGLVVRLGVAVPVLLFAGSISHEVPAREREAPPTSRDSSEREGCPCGCDRGDAFTTELRKQDLTLALHAIDASLLTIGEREAAGYVTDAMVTHRLHLAALRTELAPSASLPTWPIASVGGPAIEGSDLRVRAELVVHGDTTERVKGRDKRLPASFLLRLAIENVGDVTRDLPPPRIAADFPFTVRRWYVNGTTGEPWDGVLPAGEVVDLLVIGDLDDRVKPGVAVGARVALDEITIPLRTHAYRRWDDPLEPQR